MLSPSDQLALYQLLLEDISALSQRRQTTNDVFVAINTVFLTGTGFLLFSSHFDSWWLAGIMVAIAAATTPINLHWRRTIGRYRNNSRVITLTLLELEQQIALPVKLFAAKSKVRTPGRGFSQGELWLAKYFVLLYPLLAALTIGLIGLIKAGILPALHM